MTLTPRIATLFFVVQLATGAVVARAADAEGAAPAAASADELAKQLSNPVASLISVPFQQNFDFGYGDSDGWRSTLNVQPVIPISIGPEWNVIQRVILPVIHQEDVLGGGSQSGLGDTVASSFLSPKKPGPGGWVWGAGPVFLLPTATDDAFASKKWGTGPTVVALKQEGQWTYGGLANHIASFAGSDSTPYVNSTFLQPFVSFGAGRGRTYGANFEATYDWRTSDATIPVNVFASQVLKFGSQRVSLSIGGRVYLDRPEGGPDWGLRLVFVLLYPK